MNTQTNTSESGFERAASAPAPLAATRPLYWSVRRELWENRAVVIAPLAVACVALLGFLIGSFALPNRVRAATMLDPVKRADALAEPYGFVAMLLVFTAFIVGVFYCLDALHGERRDRSILFWKSMPVSDLTTVLLKAAIPIVVLPAVVLAITVAVHLLMLLINAAALSARDVGAAALSDLPLAQLDVVLLYGLVVTALWHAPLYGWLLLVSAWARRTPFLWAVLPLLAVCILEQIAFGSSHFANLLADRLVGGYHAAFAADAPHRHDVMPLTALEPLKFLSSPGLWLGLASAAALLAAAVRLRRYRQPI